MTHTQVQWGRGNTAQVAAYTGTAGEVILNTDDYSIAIQDGVTAGGKSRIVPMLPRPSGRLTLTSGTPVLTADVTAAATVYHTPYIGNWIPVYNGTVWVSWSFAELPLSLDSNAGHTGYQASGSLFDLFVFNNLGTLTLGTGPAWTSTTARGSGAGTTQLASLNGILTNAVAIVLRFGSVSGNTISVPINQATYVGTMYATANGQTGAQFAPAAAGGGNSTILGLWNAYNRVKVAAWSMDSTVSWTYNSATVRAANNNNSNRISWVDGLAQSFVEVNHAGVPQASGTNPGVIYVGLDSTSVSSGLPGTGTNASGSYAAAIATTLTKPLLGFHFAQALESSPGAATVTFYGLNSQQLRVSLEM